MTIFYATRDADGSRIKADADIRKFATLAEAKTWLLEPYQPAEWDRGSAVIVPGSYGDCWIKSVSPPVVGTSWIEPFGYQQLVILRPGQHPGGHGYWTTPRPSVLVVASISEAAETERWYALRSPNNQTLYGYGTAGQADRYVDTLNRGRTLNLYGAHEMTAAEIAERPYLDAEGVNLDDELAAIDGVR